MTVLAVSPWLLLTRSGGARTLYDARGHWTAAERAILDYEAHPERGTLVRVLPEDAAGLKAEGVEVQQFWSLG